MIFFTEKDFPLIDFDDVAKYCADRVNSLLIERLKAATSLYLGHNSTQIGDIPCWYEHPGGHKKMAKLLCVTDINSPWEWEWEKK